LIVWVLLATTVAVNGCLLDVATLGDGVLVMGRDSIAWDGTPGIIAAEDIGCERFYQPVTSPEGTRVAVWAGSDDQDCILLIRNSGSDVLGPWEDAGLPSWDSSGGLWFTADGRLLKDGEPAGVSLDAHHISVSPEGDRVVYTNRDDNILVMTLETGYVNIVSEEHRFYGPFFTPTGWIVSPSLDGGIWVFTEDGAISVGAGDQPVWWPSTDHIVFTRTTDDGESLLTSDLWSWSPEAGLERLTDTPDILETSPSPAAEGIYYVDATLGSLGFVEMDAP